MKTIAGQLLRIAVFVSGFLIDGHAALLVPQSSGFGAADIPNHHSRQATQGRNEDVLARMSWIPNSDSQTRQLHSRDERESASDERRIALPGALVEVEQWRTEPARSLAIGVVAGHAWYLLPMRDLPFTRRFEPFVLAEPTPEGNTRLDLLAFSPGKRITQVQMSGEVPPLT